MPFPTAQINLPACSPLCPFNAERQVGKLRKPILGIGLTRLENKPKSTAPEAGALTQGRREKFRAPGQKFRLGPLVSGAPKSRDEQKKGHSVRRCSTFGPKSSDKQIKGHSLRRCSNFRSTSSDEQNKVIAYADV